MGKTILVVDDFNSTRQIIRTILEKAGHTTILCENGEDALQHLDGKDIHLLITDLNMPDMNGIELTQAVRNSEIYYRIPILLLTTESKEEKINRALEAGITGLIKKPFDTGDFMKKVNRAIQ